MQDIAARFARDTADHAMTVLHDDGLHRHLRFQRQVWRPPLVPLKSSFYWFDLITVPGTLIFQGDGTSYVFSRSKDMFAFFRMSAYDGRPNIDYWAEKVTSGHETLKKFDDDLFVKTMREHYVELIRDGKVPPGTSKALLEHAEDYDWTYEVNARELIDSFEHKGFRFHDTWEWNFREYDWWFVWACHAIVWGIRQYDAVKAGRPAPGHAPRTVDVELPAVTHHG
jgi:hypothetical protein